MQHIAGSNLKLTDYLSRNLVGEAMSEENYDEEYVINILAEQAELNLKYGQLFADKSKHSRIKTERKENASKQIEHRTDQSQLNETFENEFHMYENEQIETITSSSPILVP